MAFGSRPIRSPSVNIGSVLEHSLVSVVIGPVLLLYSWFGKSVGILVTIVFWCALLGTAVGSRQQRTRRWFYVLYGVFIVMSFLGLVGSIAMGLIAMAHAVG